MNDLDQRLRFIELRAQGKSLQTIAEEIGVTRQTLANWGRAHEEEIRNRKAMELEALQLAYWMNKQGRIELLGESLRRIKEELEGRDLSAVATPKLLELELKLITELKKEFSAPHVMSEQEIEQAMLMRDETESPCNFYNPSPERRTPLFASENRENGENRRRRADSN
jgi:predicted transcriptional regulator